VNVRAVSITVAVFLSGAVLLGLEIVASRVLAPFFGNSLYVWGALIGVVLTGLSIGYWLGGSLADRWPSPWLLVAAISLGAVGVIAVPLLDEPVLEAIVGWDPEPRLNAVLAAVCLFGLPSIVLASVTPIAIRLRAVTMSQLGRTSGRLFSISTFGSIVGTFAAAFWLIPELGTDQLIALGAVVLLAAAAVVAAAERLLLPLALVLAGAAGATVVALQLETQTGGRLPAAQTRNWSPVYRLREALRPKLDTRGGIGVLYAKDTRYHKLLVAGGSGERLLFFDSLTQSAMDVRDPYRTEFPYTDYLQLGLAYDPGARNVLFLGLGGGSAPKRFWRDHEQLQIDVAEIDPDVVDVAYRFFAVPHDPRLRITTEDGRRYLDTTSRRFDVIAVDTYYSDSIPFHLTTREFVELARSRLKPGGVIVMNIIGAVRGSSSKLLRSLYRTYRTVFPTVVVHPVASEGSDLTGFRNIILLATDRAAPSKAFLTERWNELRRRVPTAPDLSSAIRNRVDGPIPVSDVPTLTDDYAPTDALLVFGAS
jgi:spermidine synthase